MKLSNKVLLGFLGFIFLYITAAFTELRLTGTPNILNDENSVAETVDLSGVAYVAINDVNHYVRILKGDRAKLEVRSVKGGLLKNLTYKMSGDTLVLSDFQYDKQPRVNITVFVSEASLKGVTMNNSSASIDGLEQDLLRVSVSAGGRLSMSDHKIGRIQIEVKSNSFLEISESKLDTLSATIDGSQVQVRCPVGFVSGSMTNHAFMQLSQMQQIQLKEDESSRLAVYQ
jgi:hypothetical protein